MNILVVTNLYPPQELGGYGRSMADFVWGLRERGHDIQVLSSDAPHLGSGCDVGPSGEGVDRRLRLKGTYEGGVRHLQNPKERQAIDQANANVIRNWLDSKKWDGILVGNLDLLGPELLPILLKAQCIVQHHVGFVHAPFPISAWPHNDRYRLVAASKAVRTALETAGLPIEATSVVYPGVRNELFGVETIGMPTPLNPDGSNKRPLKVCFAGLLMGSKGAHTIIEALINLHEQGVCVQANLAGSSFQKGYREQMERLLEIKGLDGAVRFVGQLNRHELARFYALHHVGVFPSIHPEAFGIVAAEMMASGLAVLSTGVGGAGELIDDGRTGLLFNGGNSSDMSQCLTRLIDDPCLLETVRNGGKKQIKNYFSVKKSAEKLEMGFTSRNSTGQEKIIF